MAWPAQAYRLFFYCRSPFNFNMVVAFKLIGFSKNTNYSLTIQTEMFGLQQGQIPVPQVMRMVAHIGTFRGLAVGTKTSTRAGRDDRRSRD